MLFLTLFYLDTLKITQLLSMIRLKPETNNFGFNYSDDKLKKARKCYIRMVICSILRNFCANLRSKKFIAKYLFNYLFLKISVANSDQLKNLYPQKVMFLNSNYYNSATIIL
jgi:hypothetical protein